MKENKEKAYSLYQKNAENGHAWSLFQQSVCLLFGEGVEMDLEKAQDPLEKIPADAPCYGLALHNLGILYTKRANKIEKEDPEKAKEFYQIAVKKLLLACNQRFVNSFTSVSAAALYHEGKGVEKNMETAVQYYEDGAKRGHIFAQYILGACCVAGMGIQKDLVRAKKLLSAATRAIPEDRIFFFGSKPFISYPHLCISEKQIEERKETIEKYQKKAKDLLSKL